MSIVTGPQLCDLMMQNTKCMRLMKLSELFNLSHFVTGSLFLQNQPAVVTFCDLI